MKIFKNLISITFASMLGIYFGTTLYSNYLYRDSNKENYYKIHILEYGPFDTYENMEDKSKEIQSYLYYSNDKGYHIILGISENNNIIEKLREKYNNYENINIREELTTNIEFIETLRQYDNLIMNSNNDELLNIENEVTAKYEELILSNYESIN